MAKRKINEPPKRETKDLTTYKKKLTVGRANRRTKKKKAPVIDITEVPMKNRVMEDYVKASKRHFPDYTPFLLKALEQFNPDTLENIITRGVDSGTKDPVQVANLTFLETEFGNFFTPGGVVSGLSRLVKRFNDKTLRYDPFDFDEIRTGARPLKKSDVTFLNKLLPENKRKAS